MSVSSDIQVSVTTCLAAVTQAFRDGEAIIEKHKQKRAQDRAPPPPRLLEDSIAQAPQEIEREHKRVIGRLEDAYEDGDHIAIITLQQITIELQRSLLDKLKNAAFDDDDDYKPTDFTGLVDAADLGRDRTIAALHELRHRLASAQRQPVPTTSASSSASNVTTPPPVVEEPKLQANSSLDLPKAQIGDAKKWNLDSTTPSQDASGEEDAVSGAEAATSKHHHRKSLLGFLRPRNRTNSNSESRDAKDKNLTSQPIAELPAPTAAPVRPEASNTEEKPKPSSAARPQQKPFIYEEWEDNPEDIWGKRPSVDRDRHQSMAVAPDQQSTRSASTSHTVGPLLPPSPVLTLRTNSNPHNHTASTAIPIPNPENEFLGFCKCAVKLQNGDRKGSMHKCREVEPWSRHPSSSSTALQYLGCQQPKCAFRSSFAHKDTDVIWRRVFTLETKGMKVRWQFLAKSHVLQRVVIKHQYSFKCLFCVFMGLKSGVYHGVDSYLEHIASEHRGRPLNDVILFKTGCISDRVASNEDEFDINLWPLAVGTGSRGEECLMGDDLMDPSAKEANDSMFSNEPWNEGLSDFHYGGGGGHFEEAEYVRD